MVESFAVISSKADRLSATKRETPKLIHLND
jgi:hypothetical protein